MALHVIHLAEVALRATDLPRRVVFYQEVLGLETVHAFERWGQLFLPLLRR